MKNNKPTGIITSTPKISESDHKQIKEALDNSVNILKTHWINTGNKIEFIKIGS